MKKFINMATLVLISITLLLLNTNCYAKASNPSGYSTPSSFTTRKYPGTLIWPLGASYRSVSSWVGGRTAPTAGASTNHHGTDVPAPINTPIMCMADGIAYKKASYGGLGNAVIVDHNNGYYTLYGHLNSYSSILNNSSTVTVKAGDVLGYVGKTGTATGYHLHFEIAYNWWGKGLVSEYSYTWSDYNGGHAWGNYGWEIIDGSNTVQSYVYNSTDIAEDSYEFKNVTYPVTFKINTTNGWTLSGGTLTCDNQLKTITTKIVNSSGTAISGPRTHNISGYTYTIKNLDTYYTSGDTSDNGVRFSKITAAGNYKWIISATDSAGRTLTLEMPFTAVSSGTTSTSTASKPYICTHSYGSWTVQTAATCTTSGVETRVCSICGNSETRTVAALGHNYGNWTVTTAATCTTAGVETRVCSRDSSHKETRSIAALGHNYGAWTVTTAATCTAGGVETRTCSRDSSHKETRNIAALGHNYGDWTVTTAATCTTAGVETRVCSRDSSHKETRSIAALGHSYGNWAVTTAATCTAAGVETRVCSHDSNHKETRSIAALGHNPGSWVVTKEPTPDVPGTKEQRCTRCNMLLASETIPVITATGSCGDNAVWSYGNGTLTVTGTGPMFNYMNELPPWAVYKNSLTTVIISNGITHIGDYAFQSMPKISSVSLPESLTSVGYLSFDGCSALKSIFLPDEITSMGGGAFANCTELISVHLPASITAIRFNWFRNCTKLANITIPDTVTEIQDRAFKNCQALNTIEITDKVVSFGTEVFDSCPNLTIRCYDGSPAHNYAQTNNISYVIIGGKCGDHLTWRLDGTVLTISGTGSMYAYNQTTNAAPWGRDITSVFINEGVTTVGTCAFYRCTELTNVSEPSTLKAIGSMSFELCAKLGTFNIIDGVEQIGPCAFYGNNNMTRISIPASVTEIGYGAFSNCEKLTNITIASDNTYYSVTNGVVTGIRDGKLISYSAANQATNYTVPNNVTEITEYAFAGAVSLKNINIPKSVIKIGSDSFEGCSLTEICCWDESTAHLYAKDKGIHWVLLDTPLNNPDFTFPGATQIVDEEAFTGIAAKRVKLPEGIQAIRRLAFANCPNLVGVYIPEDCTSIATNAFSGCANLTIYGHEGSYAEFYAGKHGFAFKAVD